MQWKNKRYVVKLYSMFTNIRLLYSILAIIRQFFYENISLLYSFLIFCIIHKNNSDNTCFFTTTSTTIY